MHLDCLHGYYIFTETRVGQVSDFMYLTGLSLVKKGHYFTFESLKDIGTYSLFNMDLFNFKAIKTFSGEPWEIFKANNIVYDFTKDEIKPIASITNKVKIQNAGNKYVSNGLLLAGSIDQNGNKIESFSGFYSRDLARWIYSEVKNAAS